MRHWIFYRQDTGEVTHRYRAPDDQPPQDDTVPPGGSCIECLPETDARRVRVDLSGGEPAVVDRDPMPATVGSTDIAADALEECVVGSIPPGTRVWYFGEDWPSDVPPTEPVDDGSWEFATDTPGRYGVRFEHPLYLPLELEITAS